MHNFYDDGSKGVLCGHTKFVCLDGCWRLGQPNEQPTSLFTFIQYHKEIVCPLLIS